MDPARAIKDAVNVLQLPIDSGQATSDPKSGTEAAAIKNTSGAVKSQRLALSTSRKRTEAWS